MFWKTSLDENATNANDSYSSMENQECEESFYSPLFGMCISMPEWEALLTIIALGLVIIITIVGEFMHKHIFCVFLFIIM